MSIKDTRLGQKLSQSYHNTKEKLGHSKVNQKLRDKVATADSKLAGHKNTRQELKVRKDLGVSGKEFAQIKKGLPETKRATTDALEGHQSYQAKDAKHSHRLYERAFTGVDKNVLARPFLSFKSLLQEGAAFRQENASATDKDMRAHLLNHTFAAIDAVPKFNPAQKHAAKSLALGLIEQMSYDTGLKDIVQIRRPKSFADASAEQHGKRNEVQKFFDRNANKVNIGAAFVKNAASKAGTKVKRAATRGVKNTYNASTSVVAGTTTGTKAAALPLTAAGRYTAAIGKGVADASKDQSRQLRKQFETKPRNS